MEKHLACKVVACIVVCAYLSMFWTHGAWAAQDIAAWQLWAQRGLRFEEPAQPPAPSDGQQLTTDDRKAREAVLNGKMQRLEEEIAAQRGIRKNLLTIAIGAFAIGTTLAFGVNQVNAAIDEISVNNPEDSPQGTYEERVEACQTYVCYTEEKRDAQDSLDGIKGIGGGIFIVGAVSVIGYMWYTFNIRAKQQRFDLLRTESETLFEARGLTPEYLRRNESVAAVVQEIDLLKKKAGSNRTRSELFLRIGLGTFASGLFLFGLSNVSNTIVGNISINENDPADVSAKQNALDETDTLKDVGVVLMGTGAASGIAAFIFDRLARGHDQRINTLEDSLWRTVDRIKFQPKVNGFSVMYTYAF